ncbi:MAG: ISKra4 family transposase, partial [Pontimonas sp.]
MSNAKTDLSALTDDELAAELARRRGMRQLGADATTMEDAAEDFAHRMAHDEFAVFLVEKSRTEDNSPKRCPRCGAQCRVRERAVQRKVRSTTGEHTLRRNRHFCEACRSGFFPLDQELDLPDEGELTSKLESRILDVGLHSPFEEAAERWRVHHLCPISENLVRRVVDRVGRRAEQTSAIHLAEELRPLAPEPAQVLVVATDGSMVPTRGEDSWREVKLGVVYRGEHHASKGRRGLISQARYVAHLGDVAGFKADLDTVLAVERADCTPTIAWLGDGAPWNWNLADEICPTAIQVLDMYHAVEYAADVARNLFSDDDVSRGLWLARIKALLWNGQREILFEELEACLFLVEGEDRERLKKVIGYYRTNEKRIDYASFRALGLPCGSGVIESGHRHVLQARMKLTGQHWDPKRAARMAKLRAAVATSGPARVHGALSRAAARSLELGR